MQDLEQIQVARVKLNDKWGEPLGEALIDAEYRLKDTLTYHGRCWSRRDAEGKVWWEVENAEIIRLEEKK